MKYLAVILLLCSCSSTQTVVLDGSRSTDPDGIIKKWHWSGGIIDSPDSVITRARVKKGDVIMLVVTDNQDATNVATKTF